MDNKSASNSLAALGHEARLHIFRLLVQAGEDGLNVGAIGGHVGLPPSTLAHHLKVLSDAGLILQERHGREVVSRASYESMNRLVGFLSESCCSGVPSANPSELSAAE